LLIARIIIKLLEIPKEYAKISISPNGDKKRSESGGISPISGIVEAIAAKANPVDQAEKSPHATPNPGINIGSAIVVLCTKIPNASMSKTRSSNSDMKALASSSLTEDMEPIWKTAAKIPKNMKNVIILILFTLPSFLNNI